MRMFRAILVLVVLLTFCVPVTAQPGFPAGADEARGTARVLEITGPITSFTADMFLRQLQRAREENPKAIIVALDTPGGEVGACTRIGDGLFAIRDIPTIAFVRRQALSGGAMVAISCRYIVMTDGSSLGDCQPILPTPNSEGKIVSVGEKIESPLRSYFREKAAGNGYPPVLAGKMVSVNMEVIEIRFVHEGALEQVDLKNPAIFDLHWRDSDGKKLAFTTKTDFESWAESDRAHFERVRVVAPHGKLLTMGAVEARRLGFAKPDISTWQGMLDAFRISEARAVETSMGENLLALANTLSFILVVLGALCLFIEYKTPGFGLPGALGVLFFAMFFTAKVLSGYADYVDLVLFFMGLLLLGVEVFLLPGTIVFGVLGVLSVLSSIVLASQRFIIPELPDEWTQFQGNILEYGGSVLLAAVLMLVLARFLPESPFLRRMGLEPPAQRELAAAGTIEEDEPGLAGLLGVALTDLRPSGKLDIGGRRYDVTADGDYVRKGDHARVMRVEGNRVYVRRDERASDSSEPPPL